MEGGRRGRTGVVPADRGGRWIVWLVWVSARLLFAASEMLHIRDSSTVHWYFAAVGRPPLVIAIFLRVTSIERGKDEPTAFGPGGLPLDASGGIWGPTPP